MFDKLVAIEPVSLIPSAEEALHRFAREVVLYRDVPGDDEEIVRRIGDADAALLSYTSRITRSVMERCRNLRYIGMCCSLFRRKRQRGHPVRPGAWHSRAGHPRLRRPWRGRIRAP